jgi:hypothetical protein
MHGPPPDQPVGGGRHREPEPAAPEPITPTPAPVQPTAKPAPLPEWFATKGPEPGWLARNWSLALAAVSGVTLTLNTILSQMLVSADLYNTVTTIVAWLSTAALFLQSRQSKVNEVAKWRAQVRAKDTPPP